MGLIQFDQKRIIQPRYTDKLAADWRPDFLWVPNGGDLLRLPFGLRAGTFTGTRVQTNAGVAYSHNGTSTYSNWVFPANRASAYPYVIGASFIVGNTSAANQTAFGLGGSTAASNLYAGVGQDTATTVDSWGRAEIAGQAWEITGPTAVVGKLYNVVRVYRAQLQTHMMFVNGVAYVGDNSNTKNVSGSWKNVSAGASVRNTTPIFYGAQTVRLGFVGFSDPGDEWLRAWSIDPLRLFAPKRIWVPVSSGGGSTSLTVNETTHAHSADALTLTTSAVLTIADATHAHAAESPAPSSSLGLTIAEALHGHAVDSLTLSVTGSESLVTADATHGHAADSLALSSDTGLTVADALHGHAADNLTLDTTGAATLTTQDATHAHAVDAPMLYTDWLLAVAEATHGHAADNVSLSDAPELAPQDAMHGHTADVLALSADTWLTIQQATQAQAADRLTLSGTGIAEVTSRYIVRASVVSRVVNPSAGTRIVRPR